MGRPKNKSELLQLSQQNFESLLGCIQSMKVEDQNKEFPPGTMNRNIRDVLMHLHHWHLLFLDWYKIGMAGNKPEMPAEGYTWKTTPELNKTIWEKYVDTSLNDAMTLVKSSFSTVRKIIELHSDQELFEKKRFKWTGSTSLGSYLVSTTSSHYDWALKLIKKAKRLQSGVQ